MIVTILKLGLSVRFGMAIGHEFSRKTAVLAAFILCRPNTMLPVRILAWCEVLLRGTWTALRSIVPTFNPRHLPGMVVPAAALGALVIGLPSLAIFHSCWAMNPESWRRRWRHEIAGAE